MRAFEHVEVTARAQWRAWLAEHHRQSDSIWLVTYKKHCGDRYLDYDSTVEEALCFGWIDSHVRRVDDDRKKLLFSPRRRGSIWSALNKRRVARLEADGLMTPPGRAVIAAAQADGSWTLYDDCEALIEPPDLQTALDGSIDARVAWNGFSPSSKKGILWWIKSAKRAPTRNRRIAETARLAALGLRANYPEARGK